MHLLAFDFDGTLVADGSHEIARETLAALRDLNTAGHRLAVITGRDRLPPGVDEKLDGVLHAFAGNNGGRIELNGRLHRELHLDEGDLLATLAHELEDAYVLAFGRRAIYLTDTSVRPPEWVLARPHATLEERGDDPIQKVIFYHPEVARWRGRLRKSHPHLILTGAQEPYPHFLTVTPADADKGAALVKLSEELGVPLDRTVAFGDSDNDHAMLSLAGRAVQVGDLPLLRGVAHQAVGSHHDLPAFLRREFL